jgi:transcriptional regulator with XRE-family HTH domain
MSIPERLRLARDLAGVGSRELARLARLAETHVSLIESGIRPRIEAKTALSLARALGISVDWLLDGTGEAPEASAVRAAVEHARAARADESGEHRAVDDSAATGTD